MKPSTLILSVTCLLFINLELEAQNIDLEQVKQKLTELTQLEEEALKDGECDKMLGLMADDITFYINGNPSPPKAVIKKFCMSLPRPFKEQSKNTLSVYPLSKTSGYVIRTREIDKNDSIRVNETVTKIWNKKNGEWKMVHLQSTIKETDQK